MAAHRIPTLALALALALAFLLPGAAFAQVERDSAWDAGEALARIKLIMLGDYMIERGRHPAIGPEDIDVCQRALEDEDDAIAAAGCRGLAALARRDFFARTKRERLDHIVELLIRKLGGADSAASQAAIRALTQFARYGGGAAARRTATPAKPTATPAKPTTTPAKPTTTPAKPTTTPAKPTTTPAKRPRLLTEKQCRRIVSQCLAMLTRRDPDVLARSAGMLRAMVDDVAPQVHAEIARGLLAALAELAEFAKREHSDPRKETAARNRLKSALAAVRPPDAKLGGEMATLFLADAKAMRANHWSLYSAADCLRALANCVRVLSGEQRRAVVDYLCTTARDPDLFFMTTSGVRSPFHHHGVMSVMRMVPALDAVELAKAEAAVRALREHVEGAMAKRAGPGIEFGKKDVESVFGGTAEQFAQRRTELGKHR